jgi:hypothetical protein
MSCTYIRLAMTGILLMTAATARSADAADDHARYDGASVGYVMSNDNQDFGYGVTATSPWFFSSLAVQATAMQSYYEHGTTDEGDETWLAHSTYRLGLLGGGLTANGFLRMYGSGGVLYVVPNHKMTTKKSVAGSYGLFGFEFLSGRNLNFVLEVGANGIDAHADKLPGKPGYAAGFVTSVGFRYYL